MIREKGKLMSLVLALVMIFSVFSGIPAFADSDIPLGDSMQFDTRGFGTEDYDASIDLSMSSNATENMKPGDTFDVTVTLGAHEELTSFEYKMYFDKDVLKVNNNVEVKLFPGNTGTVSVLEGSVKHFATGEANVTGGAENILVTTFEVLETDAETTKIIMDEDDIDIAVNDTGTAEALGIHELTINLKESSVEETEIEINLSAQSENTFFPLLGKVKVSSGTAKKYGYANATSVNPGEVTALDALVKMHEIIYGAEKALINEALVVNDAGTITRFNTEDTSAISILVNGKMPHNGVLNENYKPPQYEGLTVHAMVLKPGDDVQFVQYQDTSTYIDYYSWFEHDGGSKDITVPAGKNVEFVLKGYSLMYAGLCQQESINQQTKPIEDAKVLLMDMDTREDTGKFKDVITNENGVATLNFDEPGTYALSAIGEDYPPIFSPWCVVTVTEREPENTRDVELLVSPSGTALKLFTDKERTKEVNIGSASVDNTYKAALTPGEYYYQGFDNDGTSLGGASFTVEDKEGTQTFRFQKATFFASNEGWTLGTDYTVSASIGAEKTPVLMGAIKDNTVSLLTRANLSHYYEFIPSEAKFLENYVTYSGSVIPALQNSDYIIKYEIAKVNSFTFTVPKNATLFVGTKPGGGSTHYVPFTQVEPTADPVINEEASTAAYTFNLSDNERYNYRVSMDGKVTRAGLFTKTADLNKMEITEAQLAGDPKKTDRDLGSISGQNVADIFVNINPQNYLKLQSGETYQIIPLRIWQAINDWSGNYFFEPDFNYDVLNIDGSPISIDENGIITANSNGTAIVMVSYDAITAHDTFYGAIWPENTGVFVVSVGAGNSGIDTGMIINESNSASHKLSGSAVDAEFDVFYFPEGTEGTKYSFTPSSGVSVSILRPSISKGGVNYTDFSTNGITQDGGTYTVELLEGRNIIRLEKGGNIEYQVLTAKPVKYEIINTTSPGSPIQPGNTVNVVFDTVYHPANKLAGLHNMYAQIKYTGSNGITYQGGRSQYTFNSSNSSQTIVVNIPSDFIGNTLTLTSGYIDMSYFGSPYGSHRAITYDKGISPDFSALERPAKLGSLPQIEIPISSTASAFDVTFAVTPADATAVIELKDDKGNVVQPKEDGGKVYSLTYGTYTYIVHATGYYAIEGTVNVNAEGQTTQTVEIPLVSSGGAWDGKTKNKPTESNGVYQISSPEELAWLAADVNAGNPAKDAVLTANINLNDQQWTSIGSANAPFKGSFDGKGYTVSGLYIDGSAQSQGLFGVIDSTTIKNLTVKGEVKNSAFNTAGIVGKSTGSSQITNCVNEANVSSSASYAGGVVGTIAGPISIVHCANKGDISNTMMYTGGIVGGAGSAANSKIEFSYNLGNINGGNNTGGIIGGISGITFTAENCYNQGNVTTSAGTTGGITGTITSAGNDLSLVIKNVYNTGNVSGPGSAIGAVIGNRMAYPGYQGTVENAYYLDSSAAAGIGSTNDVTGKLSEIELKTGASKLGGYFMNYTDGYPVFDTAPPAISSITGNPSTPGNDPVTLTVEATDDNAMEYSFDNGATWQAENTRTFTATTTIAAGTIQVRDVAENTSSWDQVIEIAIKSQPDPETPVEFTVSGNPTAWTNKDVTLTANVTKGELADQPYSFDGGSTWQTGNTKTFATNASIEICVKSKQGTITEKTVVNITKIDKVAPVITAVNGNPSTPGNDPVTLTVEATDDNAMEYSFDSGATWQAENARTFTATTTIAAGTIQVRDVAENTSSWDQVIEITIKSQPDPETPVEFTVSGNPTAWTNKDVTLTVNVTKGELADQPYSFDGGKTWQTGNTKSFDANSSVEICVKSKQGTVTEKNTVNVTKIDKVAPVIDEIIADKTTPTNGSVKLTVSASDQDGSGVDLYSFDNGNRWTAINFQSYSGNTTVTVVVRDAAGNVSKSVSKTIDNIGTNHPTATFNPAPGSTISRSGQTITATFSTVLQGNPTVSNDAVNVVLAQDGKSLTFTTGTYAYSSTQTFTISGLADAAGNALDASVSYIIEGSSGGTSGGKSSSSGGSEGSTRVDNSSSKVTTTIVETAPPLTEAPASSIISEAATAIKAATSEGKTSTSARVKNVGNVSMDTFSQITKLAGSTSFTLNADSMNGNSVDVRVVIRAEQATKAVNLSGSTISPAAKKLKANFEKWFTGQFFIIKLGQREAFGTTVEVIAKPNAEFAKELNANDLYVYILNDQTNTYQQVPNPGCYMDTNGYLHLFVDQGGDIIVAKQPITNK